MIYLSPNKHPYAKVKVKFDKKWQVVNCLIDTGFSSGISLPQKYLRFVKGSSKWRQSFELADGSAVEYDLYKLEFVYEGKGKIVSAIFSKGRDALLGIEFLDGFNFCLDLKNYKVSLT